MRLLVPYITCHLLVWCSFLAAQEGSKKPQPERSAPAASSSAPTGVGGVKRLTGVWLPNPTTGEPEIHTQIETFDAFYEYLHNRKEQDRAPRFSLQSVAATGIAKENRIELTVRFEARVLDPVDVRIPLRLDEAVLLDDPKYKGPGESKLLDYEEDGDGYVWYLLGGEEEQKHELTLRLWAPLSRTGDRTRMRLSVPGALRSELDLTVPISNAVAEVSGRGGVESLPGTNGGTRFKVGGLDPDFELTWYESESRRADPQPVLKAMAEIAATIQSDSVTTTAKLTVQSEGSPFNRFRVRLPPGAELVDDQRTGYTVLPTSSESKPAKNRALVEVRFPTEVMGPVEVELRTTRARESTEFSELAGFSVVQAVRQNGIIAVVIDDDWEVYWGPRHDVREVNVVPKTLQLEKPDSPCFEYTKQPCSLTARVKQRKPIIRVEPEYRVYVLKDRVELKGELKYTVHGKEVRTLKVGMSGWECDVDPAGPDNLVDTGGVELTKLGELLIPLDAPSTGELQIWIQARMPLAADISSLSLPLPRPVADSILPAKVTIHPADNVELVPDMDKMSGLSPHQRSEPSDEREGFRQEPLHYRGETAELEFAADMKIHDQSVTVDVSSEVSYGEQESRVEQSLVYNIEYERLKEITLAVPSVLAAPGKIKVLLDDQPLSTTNLNDQADSVESSGIVMKRAILTPSRIGPCELTIRYPIEGLKVQPQSTIFPTVPLVMPGDGQLASNKLSVSAAAGVVVRGSSESSEIWSAASEVPVRYRRPGVLELSADGPANEVVLNVQLEDPDTLGSTVVERAWIQTWLMRNSRQDRAVFQLTSDRSQVELSLPLGVDANTVSISLDDQTVDAESTLPGPLVIELPQEANSRPRRLEVTYQFRPRKRDPGPLSIDLPTLGDTAWVRRTYWQLVLPNAEHVIVFPDDLIPEFKWKWKGAFLGREMMDQPHLETLIGTPARASVNAATSRYLFSSLGPIQRCTLRTESRTSIVAVASLTALLVGLTFIYVPLARHPFTLLVLTILLVALTVLRPAPTFLFVQAASLGVGLTLFAALLHRGVARRYAWAVRRERSSMDYDKGSTEAEYGHVAEGNEASTETTPPGIPGPITESAP